MYEKPKILICGDKAVTVEFGDELSEECNKRVIKLYRMFKLKKIEGIISMIPTYRSLLIKYDPFKITYYELIKLVELYNNNDTEKEEVKAKVYEIPVVYSGEFGPDLDLVARYNNLTVEEVISIHTKPLYIEYL